jgi:hypothetical protein
MVLNWQKRGAGSLRHERKMAECATLVASLRGQERRIPPYELQSVAIPDEPNPVKVKWFC